MHVWLCGSCGFGGFCGFCVSNIRQTRSTSRFARFWSLWILCGSCVGRFVVFGHVWICGLARPLARRACASSGSVVLPSIPKPMPMLMIARPLARRYCASDPPHVVLWSVRRRNSSHLTRSALRALRARDAHSPWSKVFVDLWSCASTCPQGLRVRSTSCGFYGSVVLPSMLDADGCAFDRAHVVFVGRWSCPRCLVLPSMPKPTMARPLARRACASSGFPYCQKTALELQALTREPPLVVPTKRRDCAWLALACWSLWSLWSLRSSLPQWLLAGLRPNAPADGRPLLASRRQPKLHNALV